MYITISDVTGEKTINLSYPIHNCDSSKEIAVISMISSNIQYEIKEPLTLKLMEVVKNRYWVGLIGSES